MSIQLKIRRLETNETLIAEFESLEDAETWLRERPQGVDVLGALGVDAASSERLQAAMRPLDAEEQAKIAADEAELAAAARAQVEREQAAHEAEIAERRAAAASADPHRLMAVNWERGRGCRNADAADPRPVPAAVVAAVEAWVAERDSWVHRRGLQLGSADVFAWPGPIPSDEDERIRAGGQFTPVSL